jgi:hypothetical protein
MQNLYFPWLVSLIYPQETGKDVIWGRGRK